MDPDDEEDLPTLTKWPFYLGDASLVGLAVAIAALDNWQLGGVQVFACVSAVALGAVALVFPFVAEYLMFAREEKEDREAEIRLLKKQQGHLESALLKQQEQIKTVESHFSLDDQRYEMLASAIDQKTQDKVPDLSIFTERIEAIETKVANQLKTSNGLNEEWCDHKDSLQQMTESLNALKSRLDTLEEMGQQSAPGRSGKANHANDEITENGKRLKKKETSLLKRAIQEKQDTASTAVSRIIDPANSPAASDGSADSKTPVTDPISQEVSSEIEQLPDDFSVSLGADLMMDDDLFAAAETNKTKKSKKSRAVKEKQTATVSKKSAITTVEVDKMMGIGNKPFLRGSGAGLSWEKGVEMEFEEIGKWTWSSTAPIDEAMEVHVYRNDKDPDRKGKHRLEPGQSLEIVPEF